MSMMMRWPVKAMPRASSFERPAQAGKRTGTALRMTSCKAQTGMAMSRPMTTNCALERKASFALPTPKPISVAAVARKRISSVATTKRGAAISAAISRSPLMG